MSASRYRASLARPPESTEGWRTGPSHFASPDVWLYVVSRAPGGVWEFEASFHHETDLREPRFLAWNDQLWLYFAELGGNPSAFEPGQAYVTQRDGLGEWTEEVELPEGEVPKVPRWQTWYGVEDFTRMFRELYGNLSAEERTERRAFTEQAIKEIELWNASVQERSERWPLDRFLKHVSELGVCPEDMPADECALSLQSNFSGATAGNARITYSPGTMLHLLRNYGAVLGCLDTLDTLGLDATPEDEDQNFSLCFESEFPTTPC